MIMTRAVASSTNMTIHPERRSTNRVHVHAITRKKEDSLNFTCGYGIAVYTEILFVLTRALSKSIISLGN